MFFCVNYVNVTIFEPYQCYLSISLLMYSSKGWKVRTHSFVFKVKLIGQAVSEYRIYRLVILTVFISTFMLISFFRQFANQFSNSLTFNCLGSSDDIVLSIAFEKMHGEKMM